MKIREGANRASCANNLRQIAVGVFAYHDAMGYLPVNSQQASESEWDWEHQSRLQSWSWLARILPYLRQSGAPQSSSHLQCSLGQCTDLLSMPVKTYFCPSDNARVQGVSTNRANLEGIPVGLTNYKGVSGSNWCWGDWYNPGPTGDCNGLKAGDGLFYPEDWHSPRRLTDITDGMSNTFMVGEDIPSKDTHCSWPYANNAVGTCAIAPNARRSDGSEYAPTDWGNVYGFRSRHPGGLQFVLADGSVRFVSNHIPLLVYRSLATMAGSETLATQDY
jgi:prepilin-type processing-associated H-X9-DG protein